MPPPSGIASSRPPAASSTSFSLNDSNLDDYPLPGQPVATALSSSSSTAAAKRAASATHENGTHHKPTTSASSGGGGGGGGKKTRGTPTKAARPSAPSTMAASGSGTGDGGGAGNKARTTSFGSDAASGATAAAALAAAGGAGGDPSKQGKGKDLSHVPCRFFKVGACAAGGACPFSHAMPEAGQQKQICQWFVKGNCRFGHKCALAHLLPGETYAMDRKNKKAAQASQHQSPSGKHAQQQQQQQGGEGDAEYSRSPQQHELHSGSPHTGPFEESLGGINGAGSAQLASLDYTRPMSFSPPEPGLAAMMANLGRRPIPTSGSPSFLSAVPETFRPSSFDAQQQQQPLLANNKLPPIGTPPTGHSPASWIDSRVVPIAAAPSSSMTVPSTTRAFSSSVVGGEFAAMGRDIWGQRTSSSSPRIVAARALSPSHLRPRLDTRHQSDVFLMSDAEEDDDDDHGEEFLPSSLNELLTPRERARRLSRRESNQSAGAARAGWYGAQVGAGSSWDPRPDVDSLLNRQALSANATSGISRVPWGESSEATIRQSSDRVRVAGFAVSPPSAPASALSSLFNGKTEHMSTSTSDPNFQLGPSNSSLAFLSQLDPRGIGAKMSHSPSRPSPLHTATFSGAEDVPAPPARSTLVPQALQQPILSPGTRALRSHAPGQSLPQGLAAGLSRLHLQGQQTPSLAAEGQIADTGSTSLLDGQAAAKGRRGKDELEDEDLFEMDG